MIKKMMKIVITCAVMLFSVCTIANAQVQPKLIVNDAVIKTDSVTVNDTTLVPLRALMESTGAQVKWHEQDYKIDVIKGDKTLYLQIDRGHMLIGDKKVDLLAAPILYNGDTTYAPLRAVCEAFDFVVDWDEDTKTILITDPQGCVYVDIMGISNKQLVESGAMSKDEFEDYTGLSYEANMNLPYSVTQYLVTPQRVADNSGMSVDDLKEYIGLDIENEYATWGDMLGDATLQYVIPAVYGVEFTKENFADFKEYFNLGDEYIPNTKYRYVRTIVDLAEKAYYEKNEQTQTDENKKPTAEEKLAELCENKVYFTITLADSRVMKGELYPDLAKETVANFISLCEKNFYEGLIFHRVIDGFMIQGGGYDKDFNEKDAPSIFGEFDANGYANPLKHEKGVISMARTNDPNSASSQFFIMDEAAPHLDGKYAAFGRITQGLDVLESISATKTITHKLGFADVPEKPIIIKSITIDK